MLNKKKPSFQMKHYIFILVFGVSSFVYGQQTWQGKISSGNSPVPFATIAVYPKLQVTMADENGRAIFQYLPTDTIKVSCLGFMSIAIVGENLTKLSVIDLKTVVYDLDEVKIKALQNREWWGFIENKPTTGSRFSPAFQIALFIPNPDKKKGFVTKLRYFLEGSIFDQSYKIPFRVRLLSANEKGRPDADLLPELIMVKAKRPRWFEVDVSQYNVEIPENGLFVVMAFLSEKEFNYKSRKVTVVQNDGQKTKGKIPEWLSIGLTNNLKEKRSWLSINNEKWFRTDEGKQTTTNSAFQKRMEFMNHMMSAEVVY